MIEALKCPTCGGPVRLRGAETLTLCLYCNGALKIVRASGADTQIEVDPNVSGETIDRIKELILQNKRADATALYREAAKCDAATAEAAIETYVASAVTAVMFSGTLNAFGMLFYLASWGLLGGGISLIATTTHTIVGALLLAFGALNLLVLTRQAVRTLRYLSAKRATATILRHALIGKNGDVSVFLMFLDVRDPGGATFQTEARFAASKTGAAKVRPGTSFQVKYFPGDPRSVVFAGHIEPSA